VERERGGGVVAASGSFALFLGISVTAIDPLARVDLLADVRCTRVKTLVGGWISSLVAAASSLAFRLGLGEAAVSPLGRVDCALCWARWSRGWWRWWAWWGWSRATARLEKTPSVLRGFASVQGGVRRHAVDGSNEFCSQGSAEEFFRVWGSVLCSSSEKDGSSERCSAFTCSCCAVGGHEGAGGLDVAVRAGGEDAAARHGLAQIWNASIGVEVRRERWVPDVRKGHGSVPRV